MSAEIAVFLVRIASLAAALKLGWSGVGPVALMSAASAFAYFTIAPLASHAMRLRVRQAMAAT